MVGKNVFNVFVTVSDQLSRNKVVNKFCRVVGVGGVFIDAYVDFGFHLTIAVEEQLAGIEKYVTQFGVPSFKLLMHIRGEEGKYLGFSGIDDGFTYDFFVTDDNKGFKSSQDPIYGMGWYPVVYMSLSGTNYESVLVYDFADSFVLGTTHWCAERVTDESITKYKVGLTYIHKGEMHFSYSLDGTGYSGTGTTMQLYIKIYSDPAYMKTHGGSFGPDVVELAEQTVTLQS